MTPTPNFLDADAESVAVERLSESLEDELVRLRAEVERLSAQRVIVVEPSRTRTKQMHPDQLAALVKATAGAGGES